MRKLIIIKTVFAVGFTLGATATLYMVREVMEEKGMDFNEFMSREEAK